MLFLEETVDLRVFLFEVFEGLEFVVVEVAAGVFRLFALLFDEFEVAFFQAVEDECFILKLFFEGGEDCLFFFFWNFIVLSLFFGVILFLFFDGFFFFDFVVEFHDEGGHLFEIGLEYHFAVSDGEE